MPSRLSSDHRLPAGVLLCTLAAALLVAPVSTFAAEDNEAKAAARGHIPTSPLEIIESLGWAFVIPFVVASVIAVWFSIERLVILRRSRVIPRHFVDRFLAQVANGELTPQSALALCQSNGSPVAQVFAHGVRKWGKSSVEVEQAIIDGGERQVSQLKSHLRVINGVATITPLLGLLGTVIGMIQAFNDISAAAADEKAAVLAVGIATALLTTAFGLAIAIPSLVIYMYFAGKVDALVIDMDDHAQQLVHTISAEALASQSTSISQPSKRTPRPRSREAG